MKNFYFIVYVVTIVMCNCSLALGQNESVVKEQPAGTKKMVERLKQLNATAKTPFGFEYINNNDFRARMMKQVLDTTKDRNAQLNLKMVYCQELLNAGKPKEAIEGLEQILKTTGLDKTKINERTKVIFNMLGMAYMRLGEQENCITNHTGNSCIIPIQPDAVHKLKTGSEKAIEVFTDILNKLPNELSAQWLLNVAYMTLGEFPDSVPAQWRLPESTFIPDGKFPRFENIATALGIDVDDHAGGVCVEDFNNDGYLDIVTSGMGIDDQMRFFTNNGNGTFTDKTVEAGLIGIVGGLSMNHMDYNNDDFADVFVMRGGWMNKAGRYPNSLLRNNGDGTFEDVTYEAGVFSEHPTQAATWADVNLDGHIDLFIGNETANGDTSDCEFYFNNGNGTFTESAAKVGLNFRAFVKACVWGDVNRDGLPDLYISTINSPNRLYLNKGGTSVNDWKFEETGAKARVQKPMYSFPTFFFDYDNDGFEDLFVCSYDVSRYQITQDEVMQIKGIRPQTETLKMYHNNGDGTFTDVTEQMSVAKVIYGMGVNYGDLDNDGYPDFYIGTGNPDFQSIVPNKMFRNNEGKSFTDVTTNGGFGHIQKGHGIAFCDLDNDGDQDVYEQMGGAFEGDNFRNALFENPGNTNNWIVLHLKGRTANRAAIGAVIQLTISENGKQRNIYHKVCTGGSFGSSSLQAEIGVGQATIIDAVKITWPNSKQSVQTFTNVKINQKYTIAEGGDLQSIDYTPFKWQLNQMHHHDHDMHHHHH